MGVVEVESAQSVLKSVEGVLVSIFPVVALFPRRSLGLVSFDSSLGLSDSDLTGNLAQGGLWLDLHSFVEGRREHRSFLVNFLNLALDKLFVVKHKVKKSKMLEIPIFGIFDNLFELDR